MEKIGILAYGSLIEDPGCEIEPLIRYRINDVKTPFKIEFSRKSSSRDNAPTLVPVKEGGAQVEATILVLDIEIEEDKAMDLVWRRETRNEKSDKHYKFPVNPSANQVVVQKLKNFRGVETVLYTEIGANISNPTPQTLAELAVNSAKGNAGKEGKDGISYLMSVKRQNISTPLMPDYEKQILVLTSVSSLEEALEIAAKNV
jgi:cation transport regulator ChaC